MAYKIRNDLGRWVLPRDVVRILGEKALKELESKGVLYAMGRTLYLVKEPLNKGVLFRVTGGAA